MIARERGKGKKTKLGKGAVVEVLEVGKRFAKVRADGGEGWLKAKPLSKRCTPVEKEAPPGPVAQETSDPTAAPTAVESTEPADAGDQAAPDNASAGGDEAPGEAPGPTDAAEAAESTGDPPTPVEVKAAVEPAAAPAAELQPEEEQGSMVVLDVQATGIDSAVTPTLTETLVTAAQLTAEPSDYSGAAAADASRLATTATPASESSPRQWRQLAPATEPPVRFRACATFDSGRDRVVLFGGGPVDKDETWEFDGNDWQQITTATTPPGRILCGLAYDSTRQRTVLFGGPQLLDAGMAHFPETGTMLLHGAAETWELDTRIPSTRYAAHAARIALPPETITALSATYVGAASGANGATAAAGVELLIWDWNAGAWESLGTHMATDSDAEAARTLTASPMGSADDYIDNGRAWLLAAPVYGSSMPPAAIDAELLTDYLALDVVYELP